MEMFWPHYLRPIPSLTIVQFDPTAQAARETRAIARNTELSSLPVDGTHCGFRTTADVTLNPLALRQVEVRKGQQPQLVLRFRLSEGLTLDKVPMTSLRLHLSGETPVVRALYLCLCRYTTGITCMRDTMGGASQPLALEQARVSGAGFGENEGLLPYSRLSFPGFRLLQEYFAFPQKFMFVDITGLGGLQKAGLASGFDLVFNLSRLPDDMPPVSAANVLLNCTPAVNLFKHDADPIRADLRRTEYKVRPAGVDPAHFEIYTIDKVTGLLRGSAKPREYKPLFRVGVAGASGNYYRARTERAIVGEGTDVFISPVQTEGEGEVETFSLELTCTNRQLPSKLGIGDVSSPTSNSPTFARFRNITKPTASVPPPLGDDLHWRLLSHLSINYFSLLEVEALRSLLTLYNFRARVDRQAENAHRLLLESLQKITSAPATRMFMGSPVRGLDVEIEVNEESLGGDGEAFLLGNVLSEFFSQYVSLNAYSRLKVKGAKRAEIHTYPARAGRRVML
jgi:type VI secretion system protein ImpG